MLPQGNRLFPDHERLWTVLEVAVALKFEFSHREHSLIRWQMSRPTNFRVLDLAWAENRHGPRL